MKNLIHYVVFPDQESIPKPGILEMWRANLFVTVIKRGLKNLDTAIRDDNILKCMRHPTQKGVSPPKTQDTP